MGAYIATESDKVNSPTTLKIVSETLINLTNDKDFKNFE
jgi:hypothetical protein